MTYFTFRETFVGSFAFILVGAMALLCTLTLQLLYECRQTVILMLRRLYKERAHPFRLNKDVFKCASRRSAGFFTDFFTVLALFLGYILASYVFFDGVCRFIFLVLSGFSYYILDKILGKTIFKCIVFLFNIFFTIVESILSVAVFAAFIFIRIIKKPILLIIKYTRMLLIKAFEPRRKHRYIKIMNKDFECAIDALHLSS